MESVHTLEALGITSVLNMVGPLVLRPETIRSFEENKILLFKRIDAEDEGGSPLMQDHWEEAFDFIKSNTADGKGKCFVHCMAGLNRSGIIVAAYDMLSTKTNGLESVRHVRRQRGNMALSNEGFQQQLVAVARKHEMLGPMPGSEGSIIKQEAPSPPQMTSVRPAKEKTAAVLDLLTI